ncbi:MAG: hypothetical protein RLW62_12815, partial [Gammaproteobacteria bacterium]
MKSHRDTRRPARRRRARALAVAVTVACLVDVPAADLAPMAATRPGAVRPGTPAVLAGAGVDAAFTPGAASFAAVVDLPDAARPGALRPGEDRKLEPREPPAEPLFDVPPVADRPLEIDDGEKLEVSRFVLDGVHDRPALGIEVAALQALLDARLAARPEGFTVGRLQELADE